MIPALLAMVFGIALLVWSADRFVEGSAATARHLGMPTLLIGMVVIGFGTSAPEMVVSAMAALDGNPGLALGNAYGSNITNIALIVGLVSMISPIHVHSQVIRKELPLLIFFTLVAGWQLWDGELTRLDALVLLFLLVAYIGWSVFQGMHKRKDVFEEELDTELIANPMPLPKALIWLVIGLVLLIVSSRMLVWGAVTIAESYGVSELIIGLTIVAIGTSLPELASSLMAIRKKEHDLAFGNILGSGIFNTLAVVGIAAGIHPLKTEPELLYRDWTLMTVLTVALFFMGFGFGGRQGRINRIEGGLLFMVYIAYNCYLGYMVLGGG